MSMIAGLLFKRDRAYMPETIEHLMRGIQPYRADGSGWWSEGAAALVCAHQWITPESRGETGPYVDKRRSLAIAADAILDNREELFGRLGIPLDRRGEMADRELILLAYEKWGVDSPAYLIGDFAFVISDSRAECLFGARDPLGNRTLYFTENDQRFAFSTAIRPLLGLPGTNRGIDEHWLSEYLAIPTMLDAADPGSTPYSAVRQLPPAHCFRISATSSLSIRRWGSLVPSEKLRYRTDGEYIEAFRDVFGQAVQAKLRTYKGVSASLSGGLDSGAVVSFAARILVQEGKKLHTFSHVPSPDFVDWTPSSLVANERPFIEATVRHVGGSLREQYLDLSGMDPFSEMDELLDIREMPYKAFENSFWVKALYDHAGRQDTGVLLTGAQGNHTISWGPALEYYTRLFKRLRWIKLYGELQHYSRRARIGRSRLLPFIGREALNSVMPGGSTEAEDAFPSMIHPDFARKTGVLDRLKSGEAGFSLRDTDVWSQREEHFDSPAIQNLIGTSGAKFSLRYGLWERDPTADARVIRFCLALPTDQYVKHGMDRALVRRAMQGHLPDAVRLNQRVRGVQGVDWVHRMRGAWPQFMDELRALAQDSMVDGLINTPQVIAGIERIRQGASSELAMDDDVRFLMRCLIVYRFLKRSSGRSSA